MGNQCLPISKKSIISNHADKYEKEASINGIVTNSLKIVTMTWLLDRSHLFDQKDDENIQMNTFTINQNCYLVKKDVDSIPLILNDQNYQKLQYKPSVGLKICKIKNGYLIENSDKNNKQYWERVFNDWLQIKTGDAFKTGSTVFNLKKTVIDDNYMANEHKSQQRIQSMTHIGQKQCRICLDSQFSENNPMISPCQCLGSVQYLHLRCLKQWLFVSEQKSDDFILIDLKKSQCQICKASLLDSIVYQNIIATILSGDDSIPTPFSIFEGLHIDHSEKQLKTYFIYSFKKNRTFKIGRGSKVQMRTEVDRTVSRSHAQILYQNQKLYLRDCGSKFGTIKRIPSPLIVKKNLSIKRIQIGSTCISISFERVHQKENQKENENENQQKLKILKQLQPQQQNRIHFNNIVNRNEV